MERRKTPLPPLSHVILMVGTKSIAVIGTGFLGSKLATAMAVKGRYQIYSCDRGWFPM